MPSVEEKLDSDEDELDSGNSDKSNFFYSDSAVSASEDEESELDEHESERRRRECLDKMNDLENQFMRLKEKLFLEKSYQISRRLEEVKRGSAAEYLEPIHRLKTAQANKLNIAEMRLKLRKANLAHQTQAEQQAAFQNFLYEKELLYESLKYEIEDGMQKLKHEHHNTDITQAMEQNALKRRRLNNNNNDRRRKPVSVTGPFVVYMLKESVIMEDITAIKMALKQRINQ